jgi:hypothetical protein
LANDGLSLQLQQAATDQQELIMAIHLLTVNVEMQRVRLDFALHESRAALAVMTAERDALCLNVKAPHNET